MRVRWFWVARGSVGVGIRLYTAVVGVQGEGWSDLEMGGDERRGWVIEGSTDLDLALGGLNPRYMPRPP